MPLLLMALRWLRRLARGVVIAFVSFAVAFPFRGNPLAGVWVGIGAFTVIAVASWWIEIRLTTRNSRKSRTVYQTPGHFRGHATVGDGIVLDPSSETPKVKQMGHSPIWGGWQSGTLPIHVTSEGPFGRREIQSSSSGESWVWTYGNVTIVNESDEYLAFHVWLVVTTSDKVGKRELTPEPNEVVALAPHETREAAFTFRLQLWGFTEDEALNPGEPKEFQIIEDGSKCRKLVVSYEPRSTSSVPYLWSEKAPNGCSGLNLSMVGTRYAGEMYYSSSRANYVAMRGPYVPF